MRADSFSKIDHLDIAVVINELEKISIPRNDSHWLRRSLCQSRNDIICFGIIDTDDADLLTVRTDESDLRNADAVVDAGLDADEHHSFTSWGVDTALVRWPRLLLATGAGKTKRPHEAGASGCTSRAAAHDCDSDRHDHVAGATKVER